jgi:hypothetical protein
MSIEWIRLADFYGKNADGSCNMVQPGRHGTMEIRYQFAPAAGADVYDLTVTFSSAADRIVICNSDPVGAAERSFHAEVPLGLHSQFVDATAASALIATVGSHANGMIEFFFRGP